MMDRTKSNSLTNSSPRDIPVRMMDDEVIPSRSYYSSHFHVSPANEAKYSASIESIRAHSLALGDQYLKSAPSSPQEDSFIKNPLSPVQPAESILSSLLKKTNDPQYPEERQPLITQRIQSKDYASTNAPDPRMADVERCETYENMQQQEPRDLFHCVTQPLQYIPAVILGLLLNLLDAISYGMITFPLNNPIFAAFGPDGIAMFFVSCIISQLVYSCGGSSFDGGNGSMMIEVVPFLHIMVEKIIAVTGTEDSKVVIASTMVAFALSSMMTGLAFFLLGALRLGSLIGFFPRHILVGTIGGVGWFLIATGIEVSGRLDHDLEYTLPMLRTLFLDRHVFSLWFSALAVAILLRIIQAKINSPLVVPSFFMILPLAFYLVALVFRLDIHTLRDQGWIFPLVESNTPFWHFYTLYDFSAVHWRAVASALPAMLALTFFGVLHVPINVPALGVSTNKDDVDVNKELVAHGISNAVSGLLGSVQNYLVYTNSLLFIRSGGDSRVAGLMLAAATAALWMVGPWIVGYIPVMVVGSLIFHLGLDLLKEALVDTWRSVHYLEYLTIGVIIACMATLGFVEGILVGIILACVFFVVQNARSTEAIRAACTGKHMRSSIRRLYRQERYLSQVAEQIQVVKLQNYLFFGTIDQVERSIRGMLDEHAWDKHPIRFLVLDLQLVQGVDFSAAEAFVRIRRLLRTRQVYMIFCNVGQDAQKALLKAGVWADQLDMEGDLKCFEHLSDALEWCENILLTAYFRQRPKQVGPDTTIPYNQQTDHHFPIFGSSPRHEMLHNAIHHVLKESHTPHVHNNTTQPTLILVQTFGEIFPDVSFEFFHKLSRYFQRSTVEKGKTLYREGDPCDFLLILEQGSLHSTMTLLKDPVIVETILPGTVVGEMGMFVSSPTRTRSLMAEGDSVYWKLTKDSFDQMLKEDSKIANQFILLTLYFSSERLDTMTRYAYILH
ncbi:sulfate transporter family-domain-containing protein [Sporodiniella umbellata]|nr:sulfate transporter family-domain-containing protein [Sporodiniella umbellata]